MILMQAGERSRNFRQRVFLLGEYEPVFSDNRGVERARPMTDAKELKKSRRKWERH